MSNLVAGFDIYDLNDGKIVCSFTHDIGNEERATPVLFIHDGHAILGGSVVGYVNLWFVDSGIRLEPLHIPSEFIVVTCMCSRLPCMQAKRRCWLLRQVTPTLVRPIPYTDRWTRLTMTHLPTSSSLSRPS